MLHQLTREEEVKETSAEKVYFWRVGTVKESDLVAGGAGGAGGADMLVYMDSSCCRLWSLHGSSVRGETFFLVL